MTVNDTEGTPSAEKPPEPVPAGQDGVTVNDTGGTPPGSGPEGSTGQNDPETFDRAYVQRLRVENAKHRIAAKRADGLASRLLDTTVRSAGADLLADPGDLLVHVDGAELVDDDGYPDADKIIQAARTLVQAKPYLAPRRVAGDVGQGARPAASDVNLAGMLRSRAG